MAVSKADKLAQLPNVDGASYVGYTPAGTGAVDRDVQSKLREFVSVKDFGTVGDGVTDDTSAIQAAIDATNAAGGGSVFVPTGNYIITSSIIIKQGVCLQFSEKNARFSAGQDNLTVITNSVSSYGAQLLNTRIDGNGYSNVTAVSLVNFRQGSAFTKPHITNCAVGIDLGEGCFDLVVERPTFVTVTSPMKIHVYGGSLQIIHPSIYSYGNVGIDIYNDVGKDTVGTQIIGGFVQDGLIGIRDAAYKTTIIGTYFERNVTADVSLVSGSQYFSADDTQHLASIGAVCFLGRSAHAAEIKNPMMVSGGRSTGVFDFDNTCTLCKYDLEQYASKNAPLGTTTGVNKIAAYATTGTFTPTFEGATTAGTCTYSTQIGQYTLIGNVLHVAITLAWTGHTGTGKGVVKLNDITLTGFTGTGNVNPLTIVVSNYTFSGNIYAIPINTTSIGLRSFSSGAAVTLVDLDTDASLYISGSIVLS